jgi:ABC-type transport system involved in cytochrome c biogenesis permease component
MIAPADMADSHNPELQLIVINAPHSIRSDSVAARASGSGSDASHHSEDDETNSRAQRCLAHWWVLAIHLLYPALIAATGWYVSFRTMVIIVAICTPLAMGVSAVVMIVARGKWTRMQLLSVLCLPLPIVVCFGGLGAVTWVEVNEQ